MSKITLWSISGSDCSGGAGIAADVKTGHVLGAEVCTLITANTVQNSTTLKSINPVDVHVLAQQADTLIQDKMPNVIKVGMIANDEQLEWLIELLKQHRQCNPANIVVYDPVIAASVGGKLSQLNYHQLVTLLPFIDVITPNIAEAQQITELHTFSKPDLSNALHRLGVKTVIITGGHDERDYCVDSASVDNGLTINQYGLSSPKIETSYAHGSGCCYATAMAIFLAQGHLPRDAFTLTKAFINQGLIHNEHKNESYGAFEPIGFPILQSHFPTVVEETNNSYQQLKPFPQLNLENGARLGLYPVIDSLDWLEKLLPLGLEIIQLRIKNLEGEALNSSIIQAVEMAKHYDTRLFINDHWQQAIQFGAYGIHIGQEDLLQADLNAISDAGIRLGISTHGCYEFLLAQQLKPSYLAIGAIFPTQTKDMTGQIQGIDNLRQILSLRKNIPVVAIGGITPERVQSVISTDVDSVAVVTAITKAKDYRLAVNKFKQRIDSTFN